MHLRGGGGEDAKDKKTPIYQQLKEAEELHQKGILSEEEFEKERGRLAVELAMGNLNELDEYESGTSDDEDEDPELYTNYTLGRLANNAIAKRQGWGYRDTVDAFARGMRWDKTIGFSEEEKAIMARSTLRMAAEKARGLDNDHAAFELDPRRMWADAAKAFFNKLTDTDEPAEPLRDLSFFARKDLAVGEVIPITLLNYTGSAEPVPFKVKCSPVGKIQSAVWMSRCKVLNLTVANTIFQDEPIAVFLPKTCNITVDTRRVTISKDDFLARLFRSPSLLPDVAPFYRTNASEAESSLTIPRGHVMKLKNLASAKQYNGFHASVIGISTDRYQVQLIETGKKLLVSPKNLEEIGTISAVDAAARDAWELVDSMHRPRRNVTESKAQGPRPLDDDDIRELAALNISVGDSRTSPFSPITHCDGGFGRQIVTLEGKEYSKPDEAYLDSAARQRSAKELMLDLHLQRAAVQGDADRVAELIQAGASTATTRLPGTPHGEFRRTPLHIAAWECRQEAVAALLDARADVNALDANNATALHHAAVKGHREIVHLLLDAGADPCIRNQFNRSSVHRAVFYGHAEVAQMMLAAAGPRYDRAEIAEISTLGAIPLSRMPHFHEYD